MIEQAILASIEIIYFTDVKTAILVNIWYILQPFITTIICFFFWYFADRASQYIYFLISTNLMH